MTTANWIDPQLSINGRIVRLIPLSLEHAPALRRAVADGQLHTQWWTSTPSPAGMADDIAAKLARRDAGTMVPFAITTADDPEPCGVSCFYDLAPAVPRLSIGYTWIARSRWSNGVNPDMKHAMLSYAMNVLGCAAVEIRTKGTNSHSQRAIEKLGLKKDGVLRNHARLRNGQIDDAVVYSVTAEEWPGISSGLSRRLDGLGLPTGR